MTGSIALDVVIGLVFIYTFYSLMTTTIVEIITNITAQRSKMLEKGIKRMLDDDDKPLLSDTFFTQPAIKYLALSGKKPSYLHAVNFSKGVIDMLEEICDNETANTSQSAIPPSDDKQTATTPSTLGDKIEMSLRSMKQTAEKNGKGQSETMHYIAKMYRDSGKDIADFKANLEEWYDTTMDRVSGWYKRRISLITLIVGFSLAVTLNIDTFGIAKRLSVDPKVREQFVQLASTMIKDSTIRNDTTTTKQLTQRLNTLYLQSNQLNSILNANILQDRYYRLRKRELLENARIPIDSLKPVRNLLFSTIALITSRSLYLSLPGCCITAIALSLGSPFWFDLLTKLIKLRGSLPPQDSPRNYSNTASRPRKKGIQPQKAESAT